MATSDLEGFGLIFSVLDFILVVFLRHIGLKSGHLKMLIPQGKSAQIKKLKKKMTGEAPEACSDKRKPG